MKTQKIAEESQNLRLLFNGLLICISSYSMLNYLPQYPYAFAACAFALYHGLLGVTQTLQQAEDRNSIKQFSNTIMELIPLTLINIELYLDSESKTLAAVHSMFLIPLILELSVLIFTEDEEDRYKSVHMLKNLAIVGNILSLLCLSWTEDNMLLILIALSAIFTNYGKKLIARFPDQYTILGSTILFYSVTAAYLVGLKRAASIR